MYKYFQIFPLYIYLVKTEKVIEKNEKATLLLIGVKFFKETSLWVKTNPIQLPLFRVKN